MQNLVIFFFSIKFDVIIQIRQTQYLRKENKKTQILRFFVAFSHVQVYYG